MSSPLVLTVIHSRATASPRTCKLSQTMHLAKMQIYRVSFHRKHYNTIIISSFKYLFYGYDISKTSP